MEMIGEESNCKTTLFRGEQPSRLFVSYFRASTRAQQVSGLGLEAQRTAVDRYISSVNGVVIETFEEIESGSRADRPQLNAALQRCKRSCAVLVIAKLDRLARNLSFISTLMDSDVEFVAADMPSANRLTVHLVSAIAEYERLLISQRVKVALAVAKELGKSIGNPNILRAQPAAVAAAGRKADIFAMKMAAPLAEIEADGPMSLPKLARVLERRGYRTPRGKTEWCPSTVSNLRKRVARLSSISVSERRSLVLGTILANSARRLRT